MKDFEAKHLKQDIPEFRPEILFSEPSWHAVTTLDALPSGEITYRECDGRSLYIYRDDDKLRVYDSRCPHQVTNIPHLALEGTRLTCPKHHWVFDVVTGVCLEVGDRPLTEFEHKVENDTVQVYW